MIFTDYTVFFSYITSSILVTQVRESPDIAQSHTEAHTGEQEVDALGERLTAFFALLRGELSTVRAGACSIRHDFCFVWPFWNSKMFWCKFSDLTCCVLQNGKRLKCVEVLCASTISIVLGTFLEFF